MTRNITAEHLRTIECKSQTKPLIGGSSKLADTSVRSDGNLRSASVISHHSDDQNKDGNPSTSNQAAMHHKINKLQNDVDQLRLQRDQLRVENAQQADMHQPHNDGYNLRDLASHQVDTEIQDGAIGSWEALGVLRGTHRLKP